MGHPVHDIRSTVQVVVLSEQERRFEGEEV